MNNGNSTDLVQANTTAEVTYDRETGVIVIPTQIKGVTLTFAPDALTLNDKQMALLGPIGIDPEWPALVVANFLMDCGRRGFDPWSREAYLMCYKGRFVHHIGIYGFRRVAEESRQYEGRDRTVFYDADGKAFPGLWLNREEPPYAAEVTAYRTGRRPSVGVALFDEFCPLTDEWAYDPGRGQRVKTGRRVPIPMWQMGKQGGKVTHMLGKVAEAIALRQSFPNRLGAWYVPEELHVAAEESGVPPVVDDRGERRREAYRIATGGRQDGDVDAVDIGVEVTDTVTDESATLTGDQVRQMLLAEQAAQAAILGQPVDWLNKKWALARGTSPEAFAAASLQEITAQVHRWREYVAKRLREKGRHEMADRYQAAPPIGDLTALFGGDPTAPVEEPVDDADAAGAEAVAVPA